MIKRPLRLQPLDKLRRRPVIAVSSDADIAAGSFRCANIFYEGIFPRYIRAVLVFPKACFSVVVCRLDRFRCCCKRLRFAAGLTAELYYPLFRRARILKRHGGCNILCPFCSCLGARCRGFSRIFALSCLRRTSCRLCRLRGCR